MNYLFLDNGFEEIEAITTIDLLRRANIALTTVSITGNPMVLGAHNIAVEADGLIERIDFSDAEMLILPGGQPGVKNLDAHDGLKSLLERYAGEGRLLAAICAAPTIFGALGILKGKKATCYPGLEDQLTGAYVVTDQRVVTDGNITTSRGAGTSVSFALRLIEILKDTDAAAKVAAGIVYGHRR
jgi:4-methyl-5(b-hydroxyethyl)-thiazole monophosphate biosynthesis